jgi:thioredoxin 1
MPSLTLQPTSRATLAEWLDGDDWVVACLCAAWCDTCRAYRNSFDTLAQQHPDKRFVWIDIEDEADVVGDIDVENFPTLLIQRGDQVAFFGTVLPEVRLADRLISAQTTTKPGTNPEWQEFNLRERLAALS